MHGYLPQLDGLRAIAILLVLVHHALTPIPFGGLVGVDVFFVLSGYLITGLLLAEHDRSGTIDLPRFYVRRAIRLYPPLLVTVGLLLAPGLVLAPHRLYFLVDAASALTYLTPLVLLVNQGAVIVFRQTWSLGIEELFYLGWPMLLLLLLRARRWRRSVVLGSALLGTAVLTTGTIGTFEGSDMSYLSRSGSLFLGCAANAFLHRRSVRLPALVGWAGLCGLLVAVVLGTTGAPEASAVLLASTSTVALTAYLTRPRSGRLPALLGRAPLAYLGRISYELYLWHFPVFMLAGQVTGAPFYALAWWCVPLSLLLAAGTHAALAPATDRWKVRANAVLSRRVPRKVLPT